MDRARAAVVGVLGLAAFGGGLGALLLRDDLGREGGRARSGASGPTATALASPRLEAPRDATRAPSGSGASSPTPPATSAFSALLVSGFVRDLHGQPLPGARVSSVGEPTVAATTGADGGFRLELARATDPARRLALLAQAAPPLASRVTPAVLPGTRDLVVVLRPGDGTFVGRVVRTSEGHGPIPGAAIEATLGDWLARATSDREGRFHSSRELRRARSRSQ